VRKLIFASLMALSLAACQHSALMVEAPNQSSYRASAATLHYDGSNVTVDDENIAYTQRKMEEAFFGGDQPLFTRGQGITANYRYIAFDEGSQVARYLLGPIAGGSTILLEVDFVGPDGTVLSTVRGEGRVSGGFVGGSNKSGIDGAIDEIAEYAAAQFHN
jgi:hypothetical protein